MLANTKPKSHWRQLVEPRGASGQKQTLTRGDPAVERRWEVSRGHSSAGGTHEQKGVPMRRAEGPNRANRGAGTVDERTNETAGRDNCGRHLGLTNDWPKAEGPQLVGVFGVPGLRAWEGRPLDGPTAGCGKPHVRWCGRVPGRNPRHPTRSPLARRIVGRGSGPHANPAAEKKFVPIREIPVFLLGYEYSSRRPL